VTHSVRKKAVYGVIDEKNALSSSDCGDGDDGNEGEGKANCSFYLLYRFNTEYLCGHDGVWENGDDDWVDVER
jgi:hypothetical protein